MRRLLPEQPVDVDPFEAFGWERAAGPAVRLAVVASVNGLATDEEGWTSRLGGPADRRVLGALRAVSDGILVGAGSIRTGRYPPHRPPAEYRARRASAGMPEYAPLLIVTGSLELDWSLPAFTEAGTPTLVLTCAAARAKADVPPPVGRRLVVRGDEAVDLGACLDELRHRYGLRHILCEGGPRLAAGMFAEGLVDEVVLSLGPVLVPGAGPRIAAPLDRRYALRLNEIYEEGGEVFLRYEVGRDA